MLLLNVNIQFQMEKGEKLKSILKKSKRGLTITDIVDKSKFSRSTVINILSRLEGGDQISFRNVGMAKIYSVNKRKNRRKKK